LGFVDFDLVQKVNTNPKSTWRAGVNENFLGHTKESIKKLLGTKFSAQALKRIASNVTLPKVEIATSFDAREKWARCKSIATIRNQARCGSCWAFGATEAFTDRYCIATGMAQNPEFGPFYMVTCDENDSGCEGGSLSTAWSFIQNQGLPLESCMPYTIPTCPPSQQPCLNFVPTPSCPGATCTGNGTWATYHVSDVSTPGCGDFSCSADDMAKHIEANGPIEVAFTVYADFVHYKSGVYSHQSGEALGGHAVKIIGWGEENGTPYWLIANSWTVTWGNQGYFKILRGQNECGIESDPAAGTPLVRK